MWQGQRLALTPLPWRWKEQRLGVSRGATAWEAGAKKYGLEVEVALVVPLNLPLGAPPRLPLGVLQSLPQGKALRAEAMVQQAEGALVWHEGPHLLRPARRCSKVEGCYQSHVGLGLVLGPACPRGLVGVRQTAGPRQVGGVWGWLSGQAQHLGRGIV